MAITKDEQTTTRTLRWEGNKIKIYAVLIDGNFHRLHAERINDPGQSTQDRIDVFSGSEKFLLAVRNAINDLSGELGWER